MSEKNHQKKEALTIIKTDRLSLREMSPDDAGFILKLVNDPSWIQFIGDKGIRTIDAARGYIIEGPMEMYVQLGFGLWLVELKESRIPIGICGLIKRPALDDVDVGFAFLPEYRGQGYAFESASATMSHGRKAFGLTRFVAVTTPDNTRSAQLLARLGFAYEGTIRLSADAPEVSLYATVPT